MIIDLKRCVGCKACTVACKAENHTPPGVAYNVVLEEESGTYPYNKKVFIPRPCMQCERSSCTMVCPVSATYHREDGIVVVDYDKCIGCRYCIASCPYGARSFDYGHNYSEDLSNPWEQQPSPEYGQHRKRKTTNRQLAMYENALSVCIELLTELLLLVPPPVWAMLSTLAIWPTPMQNVWRTEKIYRNFWQQETICGSKKKLVTNQEYFI